MATLTEVSTNVDTFVAAITKLVDLAVAAKGSATDPQTIDEINAKLVAVITVVNDAITKLS